MKEEGKAHESRESKSFEKAEHMGGKHSAGHGGMGKKKITGFGSKLKHNMGKASNIEGPHK